MEGWSLCLKRALPPSSILLNSIGNREHKDAGGYLSHYYVMPRGVTNCRYVMCSRHQGGDH